MKEKRFPLRLCIQLLVFVILLGLGSLILFPMWRVVSVGMADIRDDLIGRLEEHLDREIKYSSISPSIFGALDIRNVRVAGEGEDPVLTVSRFRIAYSFPDLLFGRRLAIRSIRLDAPVIDLHTVRDDDILSLLDSFNADWNGGVTFLNNFTVQIRNGKFVVRGGHDWLQIDSFNLSSEIDGSQVNLDGRWDVSVLATRPLVSTPINLRLAMRVYGSGCVDSEEGEGIFSIPSIAGDALSMSPLNFALAFRDGSLGIRKVYDGLPLEMSLEYDFADGTVDAWLDSRNFRFGDVVSFYGGLEALREVLDIEISGTASLRRGQDGGLDYAVNLVGAATSDMTDGAVGGVVAAYGYTMGTGAIFEIDASGDENEVLVRALRLFLPETGDPDARFFGGAAFAGEIGLNPFSPNGTLSFDGFSVARMRDVNTDIAVRTDDGGISLRTNALRIGDAGTATLGVKLRPYGGDIDFEASVLWPGGKGVPGSAVLRGSMNSQPRRIDASLLVRSFPVWDILKMAMPMDSSPPAPLFALLGGYTVASTDFHFSTDFTQLWYETPALVLSGGDFGGTLSLSGTEQGLEIGSSHLVWGDETLRFSGSVEFDDPGSDDPRGVGFRLNAGYRGLGYFIEGTLNGDSVVLRGSNGLDVNLRSRAGGVYFGHVRAENFPIPFLGHPALLSVNANLDYDAAGLWSVDLERFEVANIVGPAGLARVVLSGGIDENGATFPVLLYEDAVGPLSGSADFFWPDGDYGFRGRLILSDGVERYTADGTFTDGNLDIEFSGASVRLYRFSRNLRNTVANGTLRLSWDASQDDALSAELYLASARGRIGVNEFTVSARAAVDGPEFTLRDLRMNFAELEGSIPAFTLNRTEGAARASARFGGVFGRRPIAGALSLDAGFGPLDSWLEMGSLLESFSGRVRVEGFRHGDGADTQNFDFVFSRDDMAIAVSGGPRNMFRFRMDSEDNFFLALSSPFPVRGSVIGTIRDNRINAHCNDLFIDLAGLFDMLPANDNFFISDGFVSASLDIRGTLSDPEFYGHARGTGVRIHIPQFISQELRPIPFTVIFDGDEIRFGPVPTAVGGGEGRVSARFFFERWLPDTFSIDIAVPRETPIPFDMNLTGFVARGDIAGNFNVSMEDRAFIHTGDLWVNHTEMGVDTDEISRAQDRAPFSRVRIPFTAAVSVTTGPATEFLYPTAVFPIVRATPEMGTRIYATADSLARQFSVTGDVRIRRGEIFYFQRSFYMRSGLLVFRENELHFDPLITARAEVRDRNENGPVTVSMIVDNAPLSSFTARFESSPPLSQVEIFTLLGQSLMGRGTDDDDFDPMQAFLVSTTDLLAQFTVVRAFEQRIRNFTRLDMFSIRTQALQNVIFSNMMAGDARSQVDTNGRLGNYFDNTTIFGGRYVGQDLFIQGMISMRHDANRTAWGGLVLQPDIGFDIQGPTINNYNLRIRWDFVPTSPENWFVNDNSITLTLSRLF